MKWQKSCNEFSSAVVVCVASMAVTVVIMATLAIYGYIECPKQISDLGESLIITSSDFSQLIIGCSEETSGVKRQLRDTTLNLIAVTNEVNDAKEIVNTYGNIPVDLKDKLGLIENLNITTHSCPSLLREAIQELTDIYNSWASVETRIKELNVENIRLMELAESCTSRLNDTAKQLREKKLNLQSVNSSYATLFNEVNQLKIDQNLQVIAYNYTTLRTEMNRVHRENQELMEIVDSLNNLNICENTFQFLKSILGNKKFSYIWNYCSNQTLKCSSCMQNWVEHSSRCFFLSSDLKPWPHARAECIRLGGDLAFVSSKNVQKFLTDLVKNGTVRQPRAAWIGLTDMIAEGKFFWVNAEALGDSYWGEGEPNNHIPEWDMEKKTGQDCVTIEAARDWTDSWDDVICTGSRHYICESKALPEFATTPPTLAEGDKSHL